MSRSLWLALVVVVAAQPALAADPDPCPGGKIKYYRNPMGAPDTSAVPKKDSMGMDYIPVCEEGSAAGAPAGTVKLSLDRIQRLGVRTEEVHERSLVRTVRAFATVQFDERRQYVVAPRFGGWIEKLMVSATGDTVAKGQPLFEVYSPELNVLQQEFVASHGLQGMAASEGRLRNLDYPASELDRLRRGEPARRTIAVPSPIAGTVVEKPAIEGMRYMAGEKLFRIVDTSIMWVIAEVYEQDLDFVKVGDRARVTVNALTDKPFEGRVALIYPDLDKQSRTARLRIEVANPDGLLRADMAARAEIEAPVAGRWPAIPESALIDGGDRRIVLVALDGGRFEPRSVKVGAHVPGYYQVLQGVKPGERVVTSANFLIDAESNLKAALESFTAGERK